MGGFAVGDVFDAGDGHARLHGLTFGGAAGLGLELQDLPGPGVAVLTGDFEFHGTVIEPPGREATPVSGSGMTGEPSLSQRHAGFANQGPGALAQGDRDQVAAQSVHQAGDQQDDRQAHAHDQTAHVRPVAHVVLGFEDHRQAVVEGDPQRQQPDPAHAEDLVPAREPPVHPQPGHRVDLLEREEEQVHAGQTHDRAGRAQAGHHRIVQMHDVVDQPRPHRQHRVDDCELEIADQLIHAKPEHQEEHHVADEVHDPAVEERAGEQLVPAEADFGTDLGHVLALVTKHIPDHSCRILQEAGAQGLGFGKVLGHLGPFGGSQ